MGIAWRPCARSCARGPVRCRPPRRGDIDRRPRILPLRRPARGQDRLDLHASAQHAAISADPGLYGVLGAPVSASPDGSSFVTIQPPSRNAEGVAIPDSRYVAAYSVGGAKWWVTRFRREGLKGRQTVHILPGVDYWNALRKHADLVVIDSPSADRSQAALTVAPFIDQTVLVVAADQPDVRSPALLRDAIVTAGGRCAGVFFNRARVEPPGFLRRFLS